MFSGPIRKGRRPVHTESKDTSMSSEHDPTGRRISLATVKELTGCTTQEQVLNRVRAGRLPRPISLSPMWFDEAAVRAAIAAREEIERQSVASSPNERA